MLVDNELPEALGGTRGSEVREIECQHGSPIALSDRHNGSVGVAKLEIRERAVDLDRAPQQRWREVDNQVLARGQRFQEQPGRVRANARAQQLVDLNDHRLGHDQLPAEFGNQARGEGVRFVTSVRRGDERAGVGDDPQRASTSSFRYRSAARPRSSGPSPVAT